MTDISTKDEIKYICESLTCQCVGSDLLMSDVNRANLLENTERS